MLTVSFLNELIFMLLGIMLGNLGKFIKLIYRSLVNAFLIRRYKGQLDENN